jgi:hypothetical protein
MLYGEEKARQMARSILPSTGRAGARHDLAAVKRRNRRSIRRELGLISGDTDRYWDEPQADLTDYPDIDITYIVWDRRAKDNVAAFIHWATESTTHISDPGDRFNAVKRVLPDGLIGRHALNCHLAYQPGFEVKYDHSFAWSSPRWRREPSAIEALKQVDVEGMVKEALENGQHKAVNRYIRDHHFAGHPTSRWDSSFKARVPGDPRYCKGCGPRFLQGLHDVVAYAAHAMRHRSEHPEFVKAVMTATGR